MKFNLQTLLTVLQAVGPATAALPEFKALYDAGVALLHSTDQETAKKGYEDLMADNDDGHARLQAKLDAAAKQG